MLRPNNLGGVPVFYWPTIATDLQEPSYYVERIQIKNDSVFGTQVLLDFDAYQLFCIRSKPPGSEWQISTDVLTERGFGIGTNAATGNRVTIGRNGVVNANINAREIVVVGKVKGNLVANDRVDIRNEGSLTGDVIAQRMVSGAQAARTEATRVSRSLAEAVASYLTDEQPTLVRHARLAQFAADVAAQAARVGDLVYVSGCLGDAALALRAISWHAAASFSAVAKFIET